MIFWRLRDSNKVLQSENVEYVAFSERYPTIKA